MKKSLLALAITLVPSLAWAQGAVLQNGPVIKFDLPGWVQDKTIMSGGKMFTDNFRGFNTSHFFDNHGPGVCSEDALTNGAYHQICIGHDVSGNATITISALNGAPAQGLSIIQNGTTYPFPGTGSGNVLGPVSSTASDIACFNNTSGTLLRDCGKTYSAEALGFVADGATSNATAMTTLFARTDSPQVIFGAGTFLIPCGTYYTAGSSISLRGAGKGNTVIRLASGCVLTSDLFKWTNKGGVQIRDLTIDLNGMADTTTQVSALAFYSTTANLQGPTLDTMQVIGGRSPTTGGAQGVFLVRMSIQDVAASMLMPTITNSRFQMTPSTIRNAAITMGGNGTGNSTAPPTHLYARVVGNELNGGALEIGGSNGTVAYNDITGFQFGTGIFLEYENPSPSATTNTHDCIVVGNTIHDTNAGLDSNSTAAGGIENNCYGATIANNRIYNLGGEGIRSYGDRASITGNTLYDNAKDTTVIGNYVRAGISIVWANRAPYNSTRVFLGNNYSYDSGAATQLYGMADANGTVGPVIQQGNEFSGPTSATLQQSVQGTWSGDPWQDYIPVLSCTTGTLTTPGSSAGSFRYDPNGTVYYVIQPVITTNGTCGGTLLATLPVPIPAYNNPTGIRYVGIGENLSTGTGINGLIAPGGTTISLRKYDSSYPGADATTLSVSGVYRTVP